MSTEAGNASRRSGGLDLLSFARVLEAGVQPARQHAKAMLPAAAAPLLVVALLAVFVQWRYINRLGQMVEQDDLQGIFGEVSITLGASLLFFLVYLLAFSALTFGAMDVLRGKPVSMSSAWARVLRPGTLLTLLSCALMAVISFLACMLPSLFVVPVMAFVLGVMAAEHKAGFGAFARGFSLARFDAKQRFFTVDLPWLWMLGVLFVGTVILQALSFVVQLPFVVAQQVLTFRQLLESESTVIPPGMLWLQSPSVLLGALVTSVGWLYMAFSVAGLFLEVRRAKEGEDLAQAMRGVLGTDTGEPQGL